MRKHAASVAERTPATHPSRGLPPSWQQLESQHPEIVEAYNELSNVCRQAGPLDAATVALVKLAVSIGCAAPRTVHSHAKKALREGVEPAALRQVVFIALPTIGLPAALDALAWVEESIEEIDPKAP